MSVDTRRDAARRYDDRPEVFCRDCRWYGTQHRSGRVIQEVPWCGHPHAFFTVMTPIGRESRRHTPSERNCDNDCADFQPLGRWRTFWRDFARAVWMLLVWLAFGLVLWWAAGGGR